MVLLPLGVRAAPAAPAAPAVQMAGRHSVARRAVDQEEGHQVDSAEVQEADLV